MELQGTRDLFGRLLFISTTENIDLAKVFTYPLVPVPPAIAHLDGTMNKTNKSNLMHRLEKMGEGPAPTSVDVTLVDAKFMLNTLQNVPRTMGEISKQILQILCNMSAEVHFICDTYVVPLIKGIERTRRGSDDDHFSVTGPDQRRPNDWQHALQSPSFKTTFFQYLTKEWQSDTHGDILHGREIYVAIDRVCYRFTEQDGGVHREMVPPYQCEHEEADTRLIYHLGKLILQDNNNRQYAVRSNDTDVLILLLYHMSQLDQSNVWMDAGLSSRNTRRYINIETLNRLIGPLTARKEYMHSPGQIIPHRL